jgi:asparagine synthase (glutamine-hydrolysing)
MRAPITSAITALPRNETLKRGIRSLAVPDRLRRYQHVFSLQAGEKVDALFRDGLIGPETGDEILSCWREFAPLMSETDELGGFQFLELRSTLPDELLMYADKLSMAHSLEARVPYLDKEIVEFSERLSANFKVRNGSRKWLHRQVCQKFLPERILRRKKRGFAGNVVDDWFRSAKHQAMEKILLDESSQIYKYLRPSAVREMFSQHAAGNDDNHKILFSLVVFEEWLRSQNCSKN